MSVCRHLRYGLGVSLNLSVEVQDHDYKPVLWVSLLQHRVPSDDAEDTSSAEAARGSSGNLSAAGNPAGGGGEGEWIKSREPAVMQVLLSPAGGKGGSLSPAIPSYPGDAYIHPKYVRLLHAVSSTEVAAGDLDGDYSIQDQQQNTDPLRKNGAKSSIDVDDKNGSVLSKTNASSKKAGSELQSFYACDAGCLDPPVALG